MKEEESEVKNFQRIDAVMALGSERHGQAQCVSMLGNLRACINAATAACLYLN